MPIEALPESTTRTLGSSLALNDAKSVVKELIDNALDARATAVSVEIAANTLDVIQVKDNGTGIDVQDRQLLCKRGCTSKIRTIADLGRLGGSFLGFRGEALASIVELSQAVVVTTCVDGEVVGTSIKYADSGMISSFSASHPVGTTMRVQDFLNKIPVRKQTALKEATKTLQAIKYLLFSFAFARPEVRFSLKVLKGKNDKLNWTYAPTPTHSLAEVATKVVGKDIASDCIAHTIASDDSDVNIGDGWSIGALLLSAYADPVKVRSATQYISVDGRPVTTERGTMKEIAKSYKHHIQNSILSSAGSSALRPFLFMQIRCPPESYDVNVEPAKDEVIFLVPRTDQLLSLVECLFSRAYPKTDKQEEEIVNNGRDTASARDVSTLHRNMDRADLDNVEAEDGVQDNNIQEAVDSEETAVRKSNLTNPFIIAAMNAKIKPKRMDTNQASTSSGTRTGPTPDNEVEAAFEKIPPLITRPREPPPGQAEEPSIPHNSDSSPPTSPRPGPPMRRRAKASTPTEDEEAVFQTSHGSNHALLPQQLGLRVWLTPKNGLRHPAVVKAVSPDIQVAGSLGEAATEGSDSMPAFYNSIPSSSQMGRRWGSGQKPFKVPFTRRSQGSSAGGLPLTPPSSHYDQHDQFLHRDHRGPPVASEPDEDGDRILSSSYQLPSRRTKPSLETQPLSEPPESNTELNDIMDFEHRKKAAIAHQRRLAARFPPTPLKEVLGRSSQSEANGVSASRPTELRSQEGSVIEDYGAKFRSDEGPISKQSTSNPHRNRYLKALKDLSHCHPDAESQPLPDVVEDGGPPDLGTEAALRTPELSPSDPRAYLIRQRQKPSQGKSHRTKSSKLPLESTFPGSSTFDLTLSTSVFDGLEGVQKRVQRLSYSDPYVTQGKIDCTDFDSTYVSITKDMESILRKLIKTKYSTEAQDGKELISTLKIAITKSF